MHACFVRSAVALAFGAALSSAAQASVISTLANPTLGGFYCLGTDPICGQTFGQTFTVATSETTLSNFAFYLPSIVGDSLTVKLELYAWGGSNRQGAALYESGPVTYFAGSGQLASFAPGVTLTQGHEYIAYLDTAGVGNTTGHYTGFNVVDDAIYTGGTFGWERNSGDGQWSSLGIFDAQFSAEFTNGVTVPEPTSLAIFGLGLAALSLAKKRRSGAR